ncbi:hypothetical protein A4A49_36997 [Nicotiana attenuata]|uniref:Uncharacterized protein n=1 Tax=Nicotiana attenuata TaxID=49451 RepID=A0A1J6L2F9_NICAT|nr:hypothetical protein A4A49_36997 [Nicotiana attenuata]
MQRRQNKYQRDKRGHIIENAKERENGKLKGKNNGEVVTTSNKFGALGVEEADQPTLMITDGKGWGNSNEKINRLREDESKKVQEKEHLSNVEYSSSNPRKAGTTVTANQVDANPSATGIRGTVENIATVNPKVHEPRVGNLQSTTMQHARKPIVVGEGLLEEARNMEDPAGEDIGKEKGNGTVNPWKTFEVSSLDSGDLVEVLGVATVNPSLGNVYELQFKVMQEALGAMQHNASMIDEAKMMSKEQNDRAIVPKATRVMEPIPLACASRTEQTMQLQANVPFKTPIQTLHDLVTHNVAPVMIDKALK